ncbi:MAG TPA: hypothetical protein VHA75_11985 [Rugosimonospora sp.]|nr:hypothetical protein [Rugosimonospora sp.]
MRLVIGVAVLVLLGASGCAPARTDAPSQTFADYSDELLAVAGITWDTWEQHADADTVAKEDYIAECMKEQGFDYTPLDPRDADVTRGAQFDPSIPEGSREYAEVYGYGRTPVPGTNVPPGVRAFTQDDPNRAMIAAMSPTQRSAYYEALFGEATSEGVDPDSCQGEANALPAVQSPRTDELWREVQADYYAGLDAGTQTSDVIEATVRWRDCMIPAGYEIAAPADTGQFLSGKIRDEWYEATPEQVSSDHQIEVDLAVADWDCAQSSGYAMAIKDATSAYDAEFMARHRSELDGLLSTYAASPTPTES